MTDFRHEFVEYIPEALQEGVLYVSVTFATAVHQCCCGCGNPVVTPLSPTDWKMTFDGETISLSPSIGNWGFPCRSHYWMVKNRIVWARRWSPVEIEHGRTVDRLAKDKQFGGLAQKRPLPTPPEAPKQRRSNRTAKRLPRSSNR